MKQFKNGIFQFTKFEFDNKFQYIFILYFENVIIRTVMGGKKKAYTVLSH